MFFLHCYDLFPNFQGNSDWISLYYVVVVFALVMTTNCWLVVLVLGKKMDRSCWKEKSGNALSPSWTRTEWVESRNQSDVGTFFLAAVWWTQSFLHLSGCGYFISVCCFWHLASSRPLFAHLIVVRTLCFQLGFGFLMQSRSQRALPCDCVFLLLLYQLSLLCTPDFPAVTCAHLLHHNVWCMSFTCSFFTVCFYLQSPQNPLLVAVPIQMSVS